MSRSFFSLLLCAVVGLGCGREDTATKDAETTSKDIEVRGTIGLSVLTTTNPFFNVIADSMRREAALHGYELIVTSGEFDVAKQRNQVKDFIVKEVSAIVLCPCDSRAIGTAIQEANEAGIPVFTCDIACLAEDAKVVSHIATDNYGGGLQAGEAMIEALGEGGGKVVILDFKQAESCLLRVDGFKKVINEYNEGREDGRIEIVDELPGDGKKDMGQKATQDALQSHPDLAGIFAINDPSALGAYGALESAGREDQVVIIGFDGMPEGKRAIKEGKIYADPVQFPGRIGKMTAQTIIRYFDGEEVEPTQLIETSLYRQEDAENDLELKAESL